jgi:hypothetical protein
MLIAEDGATHNRLQLTRTNSGWRGWFFTGQAGSSPGYQKLTEGDNLADCVKLLNESFTTLANGAQYQGWDGDGGDSLAYRQHFADGGFTTSHIAR